MLNNNGRSELPIIRARAVIIEDKQGRERIVISVDKHNNPKISMLDPDGTQLLCAGVWLDGSARLVIYTPAGGEGAYVAVDPWGHGYLKLTGTRTDYEVTLDKGGKSTVSLGTDGGFQIRTIVISAIGGTFIEMEGVDASGVSLGGCEGTATMTLRDASGNQTSIDPQKVDSSDTREADLLAPPPDDEEE